MSALRTEAESIASALETGILDVADAVAWADRQIAAGGVPDVALCDVSIAAQKYPHDVASMLRSLPGDVDYDDAIRQTLNIALRELDAGVRDPIVIAHALFDLAVADCIPDGALKRNAYSLWDDIDLSRVTATELTPNLRLWRVWYSFLRILFLELRFECTRDYWQWKI